MCCCGGLEFVFLFGVLLIASEVMIVANKMEENKRIADLAAQLHHSGSGVFSRGQSICTDGCKFAAAATSNNFKLHISPNDGFLTVSNGETNRHVKFGNCHTDNVSQFGIDLGGQIFVDRIAEPRCIIDPGPYALIVLDKEDGIIKFIR
jgi:hypothetical protein